MTNLILGCIDGAPEFGVVEAGREKHLSIGPLPLKPSSIRPNFSLIPLPRACDDDGPPRLMLKAEFTVFADDHTGHMTVRNSAYGLWVHPDPKRSPRPVVRIEYDRDAWNKPTSHVHLHAESMEFGWIYGTAGIAPRRLQEIHFPVGGRRFRPTIEDFLKFLDHEKLFVEWKPGWNDYVRQSLRTWERLQTRAAVRRCPEAAVHQLQHMGYRVEPPTDPEEATR